MISESPTDREDPVLIPGTFMVFFFFSGLLFRGM